MPLPHRAVPRRAAPYRAAPMKSRDAPPGTTDHNTIGSFTPDPSRHGTAQCVVVPVTHMDNSNVKAATEAPYRTVRRRVARKRRTVPCVALQRSII